MTKIENAIIGLLKDDARLSPSTVSSMLAVDEQVVVTAIEKLEKKGVIVKYTVLTDDEKDDDGIVEALIEVRVSPTSKSGFDTIAEEISQHDEVKNLYLMSGSYDLCIIIEGKTLKNIALFVSEKLSGIAGVLSTATHFILKKYKISGINISSASLTRQLVHA